MRTFLRHLLLPTLSTNPRRTCSGTRRRVLRFERLGERQLLAVDTTDSTELLSADAPTSDTSTVTPLWGTTDDSGTTLSSDDGYGGYGEIPPGIINFTATLVGNSWVFTGEVVDDEEVYGLTITFGGLLDGHSTTVNQDGTFEYTYQFPSGTMGTVTAVVTDIDGLQSDEEQVYIG